MIVRPNTLEMEKDMDEANGAQQVPAQMVDTGPLPIDVLEAEMTLELRHAMDSEEQLRQQLALQAPTGHPQALMHTVLLLSGTREQITQLRRLTRDRTWDR